MLTRHHESVLTEHLLELKRNLSIIETYLSHLTPAEKAHAAECYLQTITKVQLRLHKIGERLRTKDKENTP